MSPITAIAVPLCVFANGSGAQQDPFLVADERDLSEIRNCPRDLYFLQTADIALTSTNWQPITNLNETTFRGFYDGDGHSISNLVISSTTGNLGLFHALETAEVANLELSGSVSTTGSNVNYVGLLAGSGSVVSLINISVSGTISAPGANWVGMLAGALSGPAMGNIEAAGSVTGSRRVGGVAGDTVGGAFANVESAVDVVGLSSVGGISGQSTAGAFSNVTASGDVTANDPVSAFRNFAGGLVGQASFGAYSRVSTTGNVDGGFYSGGVFGQLVDAAVSSAGATGVVSGDAYVGGIAGQVDQGALSGVYATGDVFGSGFVGGAFGELTAVSNNSRSVSVNSAFASGDVSYQQMGLVTGSLGGFVGAVGSRVFISDTYAFGKVDTSQSFWGGFGGGFTGISPVDQTSIASSFYNSSANSVDIPTPLPSFTNSQISVTGKTEQELRQLETFIADFDIESGQGIVNQGQKIWGICPGVNDGLPFLNWAVEPGACEAAALALMTPPTYSGPLVTSTMQTAPAASEVKIQGSRLNLIESIEVAGRVAEIRVQSDSELVFALAPDTELGVQSAVFSGSFGRLTVQSLVEVTAAVEASFSDLHVWSKAQPDSTVKIYARGVVGSGKVQFLVNGREVAWVRAADSSDPKLRTPSAGPMAGVSYLVRSVPLVAGRNVFEIHVSGERVLRRVATLRG